MEGAAREGLLLGSDRFGATGDCSGNAINKIIYPAKPFGGSGI
jgi:hypothetical protein